MLYKIKDDYYVLVGRKYFKVNVMLKGDDINLVPDHKTFIEKSDNLSVEQVVVNDKFKQKIKEKHFKQSKEKETKRYER